MKPPAVLLVECDGAAQAVAAPLVAAHGLALHVAGAPGEALRCAAEREYEAIVLSVRGPADVLPGFLTRITRLRPRTPLVLQVESDGGSATRPPADGIAFAVLRGPLAPESFAPCLAAALESRESRTASAIASPAPIGGQTKEMNMHPLSNQQLPERRDRSRAHPGVGFAPTYSEPSPIGHADPLEILALVAERGVPLRDLQDRYIDAVLSMTSGNKVRAARILGIDRKTLYRRAERRMGKKSAS